MSGQVQLINHLSQSGGIYKQKHSVRKLGEDVRCFDTL